MGWQYISDRYIWGEPSCIWDYGYIATLIVVVVEPCLAMLLTHHIPRRHMAAFFESLIRLPFSSSSPPSTTAGRTGKTCGFFYMKHHETIIISASAACLKCFRKNHPGRFSRPADKINSSWPPRSTVTAWDEQVGSHPLGFPWVYRYITVWSNTALPSGELT